MRLKTLLISSFLINPRLVSSFIKDSFSKARPILATKHRVKSLTGDVIQGQERGLIKYLTKREKGPRKSRLVPSKFRQPLSSSLRRSKPLFIVLVLPRHGSTCLEFPFPVRLRRDSCGFVLMKQKHVLTLKFENRHEFVSGTTPASGKIQIFLWHFPKIKFQENERNIKPRLIV